MNSDASLEVDPATVPAPRRKSGSVLRNISSNWLSLLVNVLLTLFLSPYIVSKLGVTYYGIWSLLMQFTAYLWLFDFGIRESVIKFAAQYLASGESDKLKSTVNAAVYVYAIVGLITMAGAGLMIVFLPSLFNIPADAVSTARLTLFFTAGTVAQAFIFNVYVGILIAIQKFYLVARLGTVITLIRSVLVLALLSTGYGIIAMGFVHFSLSIATSLLVYYYCRRELPELTTSFTKPLREDVSRLIGYGKYVLLANVGEKLVFASDTLVVGMFLPIASVAYFSVAGSLIGYLKQFITAMSIIISPMTSSLEATNETAKLRTVVLTSSRAAMIVGLPVALGLILLGRRFISIWMGPEFGTIAAPVLSVLSASYLVALPQHTITATLLGLGRHRITARVRFVEAILNLGLSVVLVQMIGLVGVAIGTFIPNLVLSGVVLPIVIHRALDIDLRQYYRTVYLTPWILALPFVLVCWLVDAKLAPDTLISFGLAGLACLPFYAIPIWVGALSAEERALIVARLPLNRFATWTGATSRK